jgi:catechol 2,3-dioxygenase-like lactoylglutathione lyase family enzyme
MNWNFLHRAPSAAKEPAVRDILDHMGFPIADYGRSVTFYKNALAPLGITLLKEFKLSEDGADGYAGFGRERPQFWIGTGTALKGRLHVAFAAANRQEVDAFYKAALAAGGRDNGAPGLRPHYHEKYYGGFVFDPDGHNIEAVTYVPE